MLTSLAPALRRPRIQSVFFFFFFGDVGMIEKSIAVSVGELPLRVWFEDNGLMSHKVRASLLSINTASLWTL